MCVAVCALQCVRCSMCVVVFVAVCFLGKMRMIALWLLQSVCCSMCCSVCCSVCRKVCFWQNEDDWVAGTAVYVLQCVLQYAFQCVSQCVLLAK